MVLFENSEVSRYAFNGYEIACDMCNHDLFYRKDTKVTDIKNGIFDIGNLKGTVVCLICDMCGNIRLLFQNGIAQENGDYEAESRIMPIIEDDYEEYVSSLDSKAIKDILINIDRDKYPRKYRILKKALGKSDE